jgi:K+-transporting ATPase KdpF subunit
VFIGDVRFCRGLRKADETLMNTLYLVGAVVAAGLLVYLIVALLNAENL